MYSEPGAALTVKRWTMQTPTKLPKRQPCLSTSHIQHVQQSAQDAAFTSRKLDSDIHGFGRPLAFATSSSIMQINKQRYARQTKALPFHQFFSGFCLLCRKYITGDGKIHWKACWKAQRRATWEIITSLSFGVNPRQVLYINSGDHMRGLLHNLNSMLADGDALLLEAGLDVIAAWRDQLKNHGNPCIMSIIADINKAGNVSLQAIAECTLSVLSHHGETLPVILAIENSIWAHRRKVCFTEEENIWLLQWAWFPPQDREDMLQHIKDRFLFEFLPLGRPRKSRRMLRKRLCHLWRECKQLEYSVTPWTEEQDSNLARIARSVGDVEARVYGFVEYCYVNDLRLRSSEAIVKRLRFLGCGNGEGEVEVAEGKREISYKFGSGRLRSLGLFRSGRWRSI